jgi:hypothetical protein
MQAYETNQDYETAIEDLKKAKQIDAENNKVRFLNECLDRESDSL